MHFLFTANLFPAPEIQFIVSVVKRLIPLSTTLSYAIPFTLISSLDFLTLDLQQWPHCGHDQSQGELHSSSDYA